MSRVSITLGLAVALSSLGAACSSSTPEEITNKKPTEEVPKPRQEKPRISRPAAPAATTNVQPPAEIDPARVPVEEDYAQDAAERITKRTDLQSEIRRLSAAIEKAKSRE